MLIKLKVIGNEHIRILFQVFQGGDKSNLLLTCTFAIFWQMAYIYFKKSYHKINKNYRMNLNGLMHIYNLSS